MIKSGRDDGRDRGGLTRRGRRPPWAAIGFVVVGAALWTPAAAQSGDATEETDAAAACGAVIVAQFDWPAAEFVAALVARILEDGYGCDVEAPPASPDAALAALKADGADPADRPVIVAPALPLDQADAVGVLASAALFNGEDVRGFATPEWFAATRPQLDTLSDIAANAALFAGPQGERPTLTLCPETWPCYAEGRAVALAHGLDDGFDLRPAASGAALAEELAAAHRRREPWIGYYWAPSATAAEYPLRFIPADPAVACPPNGAPDACRADFAPARLGLLYGAALADRAPEAAAALDAIALPVAAVHRALIWRSRNAAGAAAAADRFLAEEPEIWRAWVSPEAADGIRSALQRRQSSGE